MAACRPRLWRARFLAVPALLLWLGSPGAQAAIKTWDAGGGDQLWSTPNNWNTNGLPANTDTIVFASSFSSGTAIDLAGDRTINLLSITSATDFSLNNHTLTLSTGDINRSAGSGTTTINSNIILGGAAAWSVAGTGNLIANGSVSGATTFTKSGTGTLTLTNVNTYSGDTTINTGTFKLAGAGSIGNSPNIMVGSATVLDATTATGGFVVGSGQTVSGTGEIQGSTTIQLGGTLAPGNAGAGVLNTLGNIDFSTDSTFTIELNGTTVGTEYDQLNVTGSASLAGLLGVSVSILPDNNTLFFILTTTGGTTGAFSNAPTDGGTYTFDGQEFQISYQANAGTNTFTGGNDVALMVVPEPAAALLGGIGLLLILRRRRRS